MALFIFTSLITIYYKNTKDIKTSVFFAITMFYLSKIFWVARAQEISFFLFIWEFYFIEKLAEKGKKKYGIILKNNYRNFISKFPFFSISCIFCYVSTIYSIFCYGKTEYKSI